MLVYWVAILQVLLIFVISGIIIFGVVGLLRFFKGRSFWYSDPLKFARHMAYVGLVVGGLRLLEYYFFGDLH